MEEEEGKETGKARKRSKKRLEIRSARPRGRGREAANRAVAANEPVDELKPTGNVINPNLYDICDLGRDTMFEYENRFGF
jgi:hypothetical protein